MNLSGDKTACAPRCQDRFAVGSSARPKLTIFGYQGRQYFRGRGNLLLLVETLILRRVAPAQEWRFNLWPAVACALLSLLSGGGPRLYDYGDGDSECDGGQSKRNLERDPDNVERIQRERDADVYGGSSRDMRDFARDGDADSERSCVRGDTGQLGDRNIQFHDPGNGWDVDARDTARDADGRDGTASGFCDWGDGGSEHDGGESDRDLERNADGIERIQRERVADVHGRSPGNLRDCAVDDHANGRRRWIYGDVGQRNGGNF